MEFLTWCRVQWDRSLAVIALVVGIVLIVLGWIGVSGTPYIAQQVPYVVSDGIGGVLLIIVGATLWLSADMNDEWRVLDRLDERADADADDHLLVASLQERVRVLELLSQLPGDAASPAVGRARRLPASNGNGHANGSANGNGGRSTRTTKVVG